MHFSCEGIITIQTKNKKLVFKNLIVDAGLDRLGTNSFDDCTGYCAVGTSGTTPTVSDTNLGTSLAGVARNQIVFGNSSGTPVWYSFNRYSYVFPVGAIVGDVREIGFFSALGGTMFSRSLIKDSEGQPITLTILDDEQLFVTYEVRKYVPTTSTGTFNLKINGTDTSFNYTLKAAEVDTTTSGGYWYAPNSLAALASATFYEDNTLGDITGVPTGATSSSGTATVDAYTSGSFSSTINCIAEPNVANFTTGIGAIYLSNGFQVSFGTQISKNSDRRLVIPIKITWGRV